MAPVRRRWESSERTVRPGALPPLTADALAILAWRAGAGVIAGPVTNGSLRAVTRPSWPRTSTGAATALDGKAATASRANRLLRTGAMLHSRRRAGDN